MRRYALSCVVLLGLLTWGAVRSRPRQHIRHGRPWEPGHQVLPPAVPPGAPVLAIPEGPERAYWLNARSVIWKERGLDRPFALYLRSSRRHWVRLYLRREELERILDEPSVAASLLPGEWRRLGYRVDDFLDDNDGDGHPMDRGELSSSPRELQVVLLRRDG